MAMSVCDADGVRDRENKIVFACQRAACRQAHAQELATAAIHFEKLAGTAVDLLADSGAKFHFVDLAFAVRRKANRFWPQRKDHGAVRFFQRPAQDATRGDAAADFAAQEIRLPDELSSVSRRRARVDFARR